MGKTRAALVLFGVPKFFDLVWDAYVENLLSANADACFHVFVHMYDDLESITNPRNKEIDIKIQSPAHIRSIAGSGPSPLTIVTSRQGEFDNTIDWLTEDYEEKFEFRLETARNVFRQSNSLELAFAAAARIEPDIYVFARPDTFLLRTVSLPTLSNGEMYIPQWHGWPGKEVNDRFAVCSPMAAEIYARKGRAYERYVKDKAYVHNPERMLRWWLVENEVVFREIGDEAHRWWAPLVRIRGNGQIAARDAATFKLRDVDDLKALLPGSRRPAL